MSLTEGKKKGLAAVSSKGGFLGKDGIIGAAAMDQRGSLKKAIGKERGIEKDQVPAGDMTEFKTAVTKVLSQQATAILLDPEYGLPSLASVSKNAGVLLAYEKSGYDQAGPGRLPTLLPDWDVARLKKAGANCIKILLYYTPFEPKEINDQKHTWVEGIGNECRESDIPFFLEFVGYEEGLNEKGSEYAAKKPEVVGKSMEEFSKDRYGVDIMKVEVPISIKFVEGARSFDGTRAYTRQQALDAYKRCAEAARKPFIYLSAGVSNQEYTESLELAAEAGVPWSGVLCGRATWKEGIPVYATQGVAAFEEWLEGEGVKNINAVNERLKCATPWTDFPS